MNQNKRGRPRLPDGMKSVTTSIRLRPDRLVMYKKLGGAVWLSEMIDRIIDDIALQHEIEGLHEVE